MRINWTSPSTSNFWVSIAGGVTVIMIALAGRQLSDQTNFMLLYMIPIAISTWLAGRFYGLFVAVVSAISGLSLEIWGRPADQAFGQIFFNGAISLLIFFAAVLWLSRIKIILRTERKLARTDFTTGAINKRCFCDLINMEIRRFKRYRRTFTVAMIDLDNFKFVNDHMGHHAGDDVLQKVVDTLNQNLRDTDTVARLGGDEFALLLPETDAASARIVISQTQKKLLSVMQRHRFPVTFSIGVLTFKAAPHTVHEVLHRVDDLMYTAKRDGKNTVRYSVFPANIVRPERLAG